MVQQKKKTVRSIPALLTLAMLVLCACFVFSQSAAYADGSIVITKQPESVEVNYPDGAQFHVEVADPDSVASYQWQLTDGHSLFTLQGTSAKTDTLVLPSTQQDDPKMAVSCIITGKDGSVVESEPATIEVLNGEEDKTVLYVGDHAVEPGETLDLADTSMGSGKVIFSDDGVNVTFDHFQMDNSVMLYDRQLAAGCGLYLVRRNSEVPEYVFTFKGDCSINNTFYDAEYNSGGIDLNGFFRSGDQTDHPTIVLKGGVNDSLSLKGGSNAIYTDGNVDIDLFLKCEPNGDIFMDGIRCNTLILEKGALAELQTNGTGVFALGDMRLFENSSLNIRSAPTPPSVGPAAKNLIMLGGSLYAEDNAGISLDGYASTEHFPEGKYLAMMNGVSLEGGNSTINLKNSYLNIYLHADEADEPFAVNFNGIIGNEPNHSLVMDGGVIHVTVEAPQVEGCAGVVLGGKLLMENGSLLYPYVSAAGETHGVEVAVLLDINGSTIDSYVESTTGAKSYGVVCGSAVLDGNISGTLLHSKAVNGLAFAADTGERTEEEIAFEEGYEPKQIELKGTAALSLPKDGVFGLFAVPGYGEFIQAETVFDPADTSNPAEEVQIDQAIDPFPFTDVKDSDYFHDAVHWAYWNGITGGKTKTLFAPNDTCTRAQIVTFLWNASGRPEPKTTDDPFTDVGQDYYTKAVLWAVENGITAGVAADRFGPHQPVTRAQAMTFLYGAMDRPEAKLPADAPFFEDVPDDAYYAAPVAWAYANGITNGTTKTTFGPDDLCTRAQIVTFLYLTFAE
ncbi:MAG: S-layer homology domain-containing protein [Clostridia bacterium]|nr:S-layer homology domain-containing protein [Clostridia bacterium]